MTQTPEAVQKASADLEELGQIITMIASKVPSSQLQGYAAAIGIALELLGLAIGTIKPTSPEDIEVAKKLNHLGMGM